MIDLKRACLSTGILFLLAACSAGSEKAAVPLVPDTLVQRADELAYSTRVTSVLDRQNKVVRAMLGAKFPEMRSITEDSLSPADAEKALAWYQGYFAGSGWTRVALPSNGSAQNLQAWQQGDKLFAVAVTRIDPQDVPPDFDRVFLQYHVQNLEKRP